MKISGQLLAALTGILLFSSAQAAPDAELWAYWDESNPSSQQSIDHATWDQFLATYVRHDPDGINRVLYGRVTEANKQRLDDYIKKLTGLKIRQYNKSEQLAYWIDLYNALTIQVVLEHYPVESIKDIDISPGFFSNGPWGKKLVEVEGKKLSLDDIEHRILRPIWHDPRVHYAVNCASIGCPNLARDAYTGENVQQMLDQAASAYINNQRGAMVTEDGLVVSSIYEWFQSDFGGSEAGVLDHLLKYAGPKLKTAIQGGADIDRDRYDWSLNDAGASASRGSRPGS